MEFGEVFKIEADGPYCHVFFEDGKKVTLAKTLKKILDENQSIFLRINRKVAVNISKIIEHKPEFVKINNNIIFKFSRRRMKNKIILILMCMLPMALFAQVIPKDSTIKKVRVIKQGSFFILENSVETLTYKLLDVDLFLKIDSDEDSFKEHRRVQLDEERKRIIKEQLEEVEEKKELMKVLRGALRQGYDPKTNSIELNRKIEILKSKIQAVK